MKISREELQQMSVDERLELIQEIWASLGDSQESASFTEAELKLLDERMADCVREGSSFPTWDEVRARPRRSR